MKPTWHSLVALALTTFALPSFAHAKPVTSEDLVKAQENTGEWLTYGRDYRNWRYSPLKEITPENAAKLSPVWAMSTGGKFGGLESDTALPGRRTLFQRRLRTRVRGRCQVRKHRLALRAGI